MNHPMTQNDHVRRAAVFRKVLEACKKEKVCPHCAAINGVVKKVGCAIIHERLRERGAATKQRAGSEHYEKARSEFRESFEEALRQPKGGFEVPALGGAELAELIKKAHDDLHPLRVRALLRAIPEAELAFLDMSACYGRPENLLIDELLVPPVPIRPSVITDSAIGSNEDDLTVKLTDIITTNNIIRNALGGGKALVPYVMEDWEYLQLQCAMYLNGANVPNVRAGVALGEALDPRVRAAAQGQAGALPRQPERQTRRLLGPHRHLARPEPRDRRGVRPDTYRQDPHLPAARLRAQPLDAAPARAQRHRRVAGRQLRREARRTRRQESAQVRRPPPRRAELKVGDVVERHLSNGDVVLFNRQPSLHKLSIMAHARA